MSEAVTKAERQALDAIAEQDDALRARLFEWSAISSGSRNYDGLALQRDALVEACAALPGEVHLAPLAPSHVVGADGVRREQRHPEAIRLIVRPQAPVQIAITGHYDTVFPADTAFLTPVESAPGVVNGPGAADMKGGLIVALAALSALETSPHRDRVGYEMLISPDEEIGSLASAPLLHDLGARAQAAFTYEPALGPDGHFAGARKGSANYSILVRGRAAHAGRDFALGRNAIVAAARLADALDRANDQGLGVTLNVAKIDGGAPSNVVPDLAVLRLNIRAPDEQGRAWALETLDALLKSARARDPDIQFELDGGFTRPPKPMRPGQIELFQAVCAAGADLGLVLRWADSGGVCEGNNLAAAGCPSIDSLGVRGGAIHSDQEFAILDSLVERAQLSALTFVRIASGAFDISDLRTKMGQAC